MKLITYHRMLTYLIQDRVIDSYNKMTGKAFWNLDQIGGRDGWCDFQDESEWGEIRLVHQEELPVQFHRAQQYSIDIQKAEDKYQIKIDPASIPREPRANNISPVIRLNTHEAIVKALKAKLKKVYDYKQGGFSDKGILILAIQDPFFSGFENDLEIKSNNLDLVALKVLANNLAPMGSFRNILIVNDLVRFEENPNHHTYQFLP